MKQTSTLKLNLIEGTDQVDWKPLNENMEKLETETTSIRSSLTSQTSALQTKLTSETTDIRTVLANETDDLRASLEDEIDDVRTSLETETKSIRSKLSSETTDIRTVLANETDDLRAELGDEIADLAENLGSAGANARVVWGAGSVGESSTTFTFDFKPVLLFLGHPVTSSNGYTAVPVFFRGCAGVEYTAGNIKKISWGDKSVTIAPEAGDYSVAGRDFIYLAIGVDE